MSKFILILISTFIFLRSNAQNISCNFPLLANQEVKLEGFNGLKTYLIAIDTADERGNFQLSYTSSDFGMGYLISTDKKPLFIILSGEEIEIKGESLSYIETIQIVKGQENKWFEQYAKEHPKREQALSAWLYLEKMYLSDPLFSKQKKSTQFILNEKKRIKEEDNLFLSSLPKDSYVSWFLPNRKLVSSVAGVAQYRTEEIPATLSAFRNLDYTDSRLYKSGFFKDAIESHFWLLENSGKPLDSVFVEMQISIDFMLKHLVKNNDRLNEVTDFLFDLLEKHSLYKAAEYLAVKVLNEVNCTLNSDLAMQLETYRTMKKGNIAPDIQFNGDNFSPSYNSENFPKSLSDIKTKYTLIVFGASWCPKCTEEIPEITTFYAKWKEKGVEVVFVSLDEDESAYKKFVKNFPFISTCEYKKWESKSAKDYFIFATPTMYLLDRNREIILRPISVKQVDTWVDYYAANRN